MHVTTKGQVTIPLHIRQKFGITPQVEIFFMEEGGKVYLTKKKVSSRSPNKFRRFRGVATVKMSTDEIMSLTRGHQ